MGVGDFMSGIEEIGMEGKGRQEGGNREREENGDMEINEEQESAENEDERSEEKEELMMRIREKINLLRKENEERRTRIDLLRKEEELVKKIFREMAEKNPGFKEHQEVKKYL